MIQGVILDFDGTLMHLPVPWNEVRERVGPVSGAIQRRDTSALEIVEGYELRAAAHAELCPGAALLLDLLCARRLPHVILTNTSARAVRASFARCPRDPPHVLDRAVAVKPDRSAFEAALAWLGTAAAETLFVSDGAGELAVAKALGLRTVSAGERMLAEVRTAIEAARLDTIAPHYQDGSLDDFDAVLGAWTIDQLDVPPDARVAELGCGNGTSTRRLRARFPRAGLVVIDGSEVALAAAPPGVETRRALWEALPPRAEFDVVLLLRGLEHVEDPVAVLRAARGVTRPGGRLHVTVPNARSLHRLVGVERGLIKRPDELTAGDRHIGHRRVYDATLLREHVVAAGWCDAALCGGLLKPVSNAQMSALGCGRAELALLARAGALLPEHCAELWVTAGAPA